MAGDGAVLPFSLTTNALVTLADQQVPLAFDAGTVATAGALNLIGVGDAVTAFNAPIFRAPRTGTLNNLSAAVALNALGASPTVTYTFNVFTAPFPDGSVAAPVFTNVLSTAVTVPGFLVATQSVRANSAAGAVPIAPGDLIAVTVTIGSLITVALGTTTLAAGLSIV